MFTYKHKIPFQQKTENPQEQYKIMKHFYQLPWISRVSI